jgi:RNA polymerase sigma factor (sigma-70 family)
MKKGMSFPESLKEQEDLIKKVRKGIRGLRMLRAGEDEDVEGIILLELVRKNRSVTRVWIKRRVMDYIRAKGVRREKENRAAMGRSEVVIPLIDEKSLEDREKLDMVMGAANLGRNRENLIIMRYYQGMSVDEIAKVLGLSKSTVSKRLTAAVIQIKNAALDMEGLSDG